MRLLIVSHTPHYQVNGHIVGWGPTVREIDHLSSLFDEVVHLAPLHRDAAPPSALGYCAQNVRLEPVPPAGGRGPMRKCGILAMAPLYISALLRELRSADVVHVRCPANLSLMALVVMGVLRQPKSRWVKYAGNWRPAGPEPRSYQLQRWFLERGMSRGAVTVNGHWPGQPKHVHAFLNPCLTDDELAAAQRIAHTKQLTTPLRLLYVGRLESAKGVGRSLEIVAGIRKRGVDARLDLVGDGPERAAFEAHAEALGLGEVVQFSGWQARRDVAEHYAGAHLLLFPSSCSEGWPKVLSEAMAYGVVPIASNVSSIPYYLERFGIGGVHAPDDIQGFTDTIASYAAEPAQWQDESRRSAAVAGAFTYKQYLCAVKHILHI